MKDAGVCSGEHRHAGRGRVDALLERLEVEPVGGGDDDLAVDHAPLGQLGAQRLDQLREVPGHRPLVAAADLDLVPVAEDQAPEAVPLRLVGRARRDRRHGLGEHRCDGRHDGQVHAVSILCRTRRRTRGDDVAARPSPRPRSSATAAKQAAGALARRDQTGQLAATAGGAIVTAARMGRLLGRSGWRIARQLPGMSLVEQQASRLRQLASAELLRMLEVPSSTSAPPARRNSGSCCSCRTRTATPRRCAPR